MELKYEGNANKGGIYKLTNKLNGKIYIGSTVRFKTRWKQHRRELESNKHKNLYLQNAFNQDKTDNFIFEVLDIVPDKQERLDKEQEYLDKFYDNQVNCYNLSKFARAPDEQKIRKSSIELWKNPEHRKRISDKLKGHPVSDLTIQRLIERNKLPKSEETLQKMSDSKIGKHFSIRTEFKKGQSSPRKGKKSVNGSEAMKKLYSDKTKHPRYGVLGKDNPTSKVYNIKLISPEGIVYGPITCAAQFAREHGLLSGSLNKLLTGKQKSLNNWRIKED